MILRTIILLLLSFPASADPDALRILSWNVSGDAFEREPAVFAGLLGWAEPDIVLLDEVSPRARLKALPALMQSAPGLPDWNVHVGESGGRQRGVILTRHAMTPVAALSGVVPYPADEQTGLVERMAARERQNRGFTMDNGIPVNAAIVDTGTKRLLVVVADLQCCGDGPESWQEARRRVEARVIRERIRDCAASERPDGLVLAGDFNLVNGAFALSILGGPYPAPLHGLTPAELYHRDGRSSWTWDGRGTPFPNGTLDFQLYSSATLRPVHGLILDTERADAETLERLDLAPGDAAKAGRHRPLLLVYRWH